MSFKNRQNESNPKKYSVTLTMSSSILAGIVALSGSAEAVNAEEVDVDQQELEELYQQYNAIEATEEVDEETSDSEEANSESEEVQEEVEIVKAQLVDMIEKAGGEDVLAQLDIAQLTTDELDQVFDALLTRQIEEEETVSVTAEESAEVEDLEESSENTEESFVEESEEEETSEVEDSELVEEVNTYSLASAEEVEETTEEENNEEIEETSEEESNEEEEALEEPVEEEESEVEEAPVEEEVSEEQEEEVEAEEEAEPAPSQSSATSESARTYTVRRGDTLNQIARQHNTTVNEIVRLNNISNPNQISVGQVLALNAAGQSSARSNASNNSSRSSSNTSQSTGSIGRAETPAQFIEQVGPYAQRVAQEHGVYASVMIAQAALESGYGQSGLSLPPNHNLFGIKGSYNGQSVTVQTREYFNGQWVTINDRFKRYPSYEESFVDYALTLRNGPSWNSQYYSGAWIENTNSYRDATAWLQGRYATDPSYASKLNNLIETYNLTRFDAGGSGSSGGSSTPSTPATPPSSSGGSSGNSGSGSTSSYTVVRGDTLFSIARRYNTTVAAIRSANNLSSDTIYVNQRLTIPGQSSGGGSSSNGGSSNSGGSQGSSSQATGTYTIVRGDTLYSIARRHNTTVAQLKSLNNLSSDTIYVNQQIQVPGGSSSSSNTGASETPSSSQSGSSYTIQAGDTLFSIARRNNTSVSALREANNLSSDLIFVGQRIQLPGGSGSSSSSNTGSSSSSQSSSRYTVVAGDTLYGIARRHNTSVSQLKETNRLSSDTIYVGQQLTVPGASSSSSSTESTGSSSSSTYNVVAGDTLYSIARRHNTTVAQLKADNNMSSDTIYVGQSLRVSGSSEESRSTSSSSGAASSNRSNGTYVVKAGDTLFAIARQHNSSVSEIRELNNLSSDTIYVDQELTVPGASGTTASSSSTSSSSSSSSTGANRSNAGGSYTVVRGDSLYSIARAHNTTVAALKEANSLSGETIYVDQRLTVPNSGENHSSSNRSSSSSSRSLDVTYTVKSGDTLSAIARKYNVSVADIQRWNDLEDADRLSIDQQLTIQLSDSSNQVNRSTTESSSSSSSGSYTVQAGDSLYAIARELGTTVQELKEHNNLRSDLIIVGQELRVRA